MKKALLIDYYGTCDGEGNPIGHSLKVQGEYVRLLKGYYQVGLAASPCLITDKTDGIQENIVLKHDICAEGASLSKRIADKCKLLSNIRTVLKIRDYDIFWFYRTDFFLMFFMIFMKKPKGVKLIAQTYQTEFGKGLPGKLLRMFYEMGLHKFDGIIYTQKDMKISCANKLYIPDYYYYEEKYGKYRTEDKQDMAVCLGTMNPYKKLEELVDAFNKNGMKLLVKGYFYDEERYRRLCERKKDNIEICDAILSEEEYYRTLAGARFSVLPYDTGQYQCRTSGIMLESLFLNSVIVAPQMLLEQNGIDGLGFEDYNELADVAFFRERQGVDRARVLEEYSEKEIRRKVVGFLEL